MENPPEVAFAAASRGRFLRSVMRGWTNNFRALAYIKHATVIAPVMGKSTTKSSTPAMNTFSLATQVAFEPTFHQMVDTEST